MTYRGSKWLVMLGLVSVFFMAGCATSQPSAEAAPEPQVEAEQAVKVDDAVKPAETEVVFDLAPHLKAGFVLIEEEGRIWVFREGSADLEEFKAKGEPAKQVIRPGSGIGGVTLKATASETIDEYLTTLPGWVTIMEDGRLWVFAAGSEELSQFLTDGEPAKQVVRPLAGPYDLTIKSVDVETLDAYLAAWSAK